ncbi:MAG: DUF2063 domain-containing protein [Gammaproteobacteria bacterium]|nr:MAG: DUF2063 domain-containing protein [Gammaproteobacteria bacterium]
MAADRPSFQDTQYRFAANIRDPAGAPAPDDVEHRRMAVYQRLFFNNVRTLLGWNFPTLRRLHSPERWNSLIRDYFSRHQAKTPYFPRIAEEFLAYLQNERDAENDPPFMLELAHYEWVEHALAIADVDLDSIESDPKGDLMAGVAILSPLAWSFSYRFPVHRIGLKHRPTKAPESPTHLVVYRSRNDEIGYLELNAVSARLLQLLGENDDRPTRELLSQIAKELNHSDPDVVIRGGSELMEDFRRRDIVLGLRP